MQSQFNNSNNNNEFLTKETLTVSPTNTRNNSLTGINLVRSFSSSSSNSNNNEEENKHLENSLLFGASRETLVNALDSSSVLVKGLQAFNQEKWTIHYPHQLGLAGTSSNSKVTNSAPSSPRSGYKGPRSSSLRRSSSMHLDEISDSDDTDGESVTSNSSSTTGRVGGGSSSSSKRPSLSGRSYSTADTLSRVSSSTNLTSNSSTAPHHPLSILSIDLKLGHPSSPTASLPALLPSLSLSTLSQLLSRRLTTSLAHISSLRSRVIDKSSRILITGDLNAGKSTLINALLRREIMPSDQQPCTTIFCEVLDAQSYNEGKEELHAIKEIETYDRLNQDTFDLYHLDKVNDVQDLGDVYQIIKAYVTDARGIVTEAASGIEKDTTLSTPSSTTTTTTSTEPNPSFINNGLVSISLIDAPGLNRDTLSTTALFARQSEIDVIVFVVSAENHFTLSAKEFLWNASREKAYVFIVVNKWKAIKDKARCMRIVGEQIQQLSPATWENRNELVHFVDAAEVMENGNEDGVEVSSNESFEHLEQSLRSFVLLKRSKSKLAPAKHYLLNLLSDLATLADSNVEAANTELIEALNLLSKVKPIHERLSAQRDEVELGVDTVEESVVDKVKTSTFNRLERALNYVSKGELIPTLLNDTTRIIISGLESLNTPTELPSYPGVLGIWNWANEVKKTLVRALESEVRSAEDDARIATVAGVQRVQTDLGEKFLPGTESSSSSSSSTVTEQTGEEKNERVFRPEVMFAKRRRGVGRLAARGVSTGLGLGTSSSISGGINWSAIDFDISFLDLFDLEKIYSATGKPSLGPKNAEDDALETGALISLGVGGMGMIGSRLIGIKGTVESISKVLEMLGSKQARTWAGPVIGLLTVGIAVYVVIDLPRAIPRNIGRKLQQALSSSEIESTSSSSSSTSLSTLVPTSFSSAHSDRIGRETRKVLRLAGWDLRERFRAALEKSANERREVEITLGKAEGALSWLNDFVEKVSKEQIRVEEVELEL